MLDDEAQRDLVAEMLGESVGRDILMNIVFGNLAAEDVRFFVRTSGLPGCISPFYTRSQGRASATCGPAILRPGSVYLQAPSVSASCVSSAADSWLSWAVERRCRTQR